MANSPTPETQHRIEHVTFTSIEDEFHRPVSLARGFLSRVEQGRIGRKEKSRYCILTHRYLAIFQKVRTVDLPPLLPFGK